VATASPGNGLPWGEFASTHSFAIEVDGTIQASFAECSGLAATVSVDKWEEGGANRTTLKFPGRVDYDNLTLKHGIADSLDLYNWFLEVLKLGGQARPRLRKPITIKLLSSTHTDVIRSWQFADAFPIKWTGPQLQATSNTIAVETISFVHGGLVGIG